MFTGSPNTAVIFRRGTTKRVIPGTDFKDTQPHTFEWSMLILSTQRTRENTGTFLDWPFLYPYEWSFYRACADTSIRLVEMERPSVI